MNYHKQHQRAYTQLHIAIAAMVEDWELGEDWKQHIPEICKKFKEWNQPPPMEVKTWRNNENRGSWT